MMDYQGFADHVGMPCCVMSVQKTAAGWGEIRIVAANMPYKTTMGPAYYDNMIYSELVPQDNKFEEFCYHAAVLGQRMHAYVETRALGCWTDQTLIPLASDRDDMGYCQFIFEFTEEAEADRMASVSINNAETVIEACIKLVGAADLQESIGDVLDIVMEETGARASRILLIDREKRSYVNFCERVVGDARPEPGKDALSFDLVESWEKTIGVSNALIIKNAQDLAALEKEHPVWAKSLRDNMVRSMVLIPLRRENTIIGYMYLLNFDVKKVVEVKELVELMSFFLGSEIYNYLLLQKLEELSQVDVLTGVHNRRAMVSRVNYISSCKPKKPYGVINIDLNGLKTVNDRDGHDAGDRLLVQAAALLKKQFRRDDLFRTGGDEFLILTYDIREDLFMEKLERLRRDSEANHLSLAIGSFWCDGSVELTPAFRMADERMYADKQAFYERNPELKRR